MKHPRLLTDNRVWGTRILLAAFLPPGLMFASMLLVAKDDATLSYAGGAASMLLGIVLVARWPLPLWARIVLPILYAMAMYWVLFGVAVSTVCARFNECL